MESPTHQDEEPIHRDESPIDLARLRQKLPKPLRRFLPSGGGHHHREEEKLTFGFITFLVSESFIFLSFIVSYLALRLSAQAWLPPGVSGPELSSSTIIISVVLLASSFVIYLAERARKRNQLNQFRLLWLLTSAMGALFLHGEIKEWLGLDFRLSTGLVGGTFYLLTGFHSLHVTAGLVLQTIMLIRSFMPRNYDKGHFGVTATTLFWHFVDGVWVILFSILYLW